MTDVHIVHARHPVTGEMGYEGMHVDYSCYPSIASLEFRVRELIYDGWEVWSEDRASRRVYLFRKKQESDKDLLLSQE